MEGSSGRARAGAPRVGSPAGTSPVPQAAPSNRPASARALRARVVHRAELTQAGGTRGAIVEQRIDHPAIVRPRAQGDRVGQRYGRVGRTV